MAKYILKRLFQMFIALIITSFFVFMIINLIPGDPAQIMAGTNATEEQVEALRIKFGLDKSILERYFIWLGNVITGDLGNSFVNGQPIVGMVRSRIFYTIELAVSATLLSVIISIPLGVYTGLHPKGVINSIITALSALFFAIPGFYLGLLLIIVFALFLSMLPASGCVLFSINPIGHIKCLILPSFTIALGMSAKIIRFLHSSIQDVMQQDHVIAAIARGDSRVRIIIHHILRNSLVPIITIIGLQMGDLLGGSLIIEQIFSWPGIGQLTIQAINWRDYTLLQTNVLYIVVMFMVVNLAVDIINGLVNPMTRAR